MANEAIEVGLQTRAQIVDEDDLLVAAAGADTQAAGRLYDKYYEAIFGYIYRSTLDRTTAEDLTSNVFFAAFRHLRRPRWRPMRFQAWLYRIATNEVRMHYRKARRSRAFRTEARGSEIAVSPPASDKSVASEEYRLLHEALVRLKPKYRNAIVLRYFEGKTMAEISEITGYKQGTLRCQLHRGLAQLQDILLRYGVLPHQGETKP
ncbi:MAG: sigma-70 family RNA polymerase sigma factor [Phycisphaerales bacterium]|nr:MAG: sigma-70 family RNA polymerase sigma factor [Phycisphaerales bacterium]